MTRKEPSEESLLACRILRAFPDLSNYSAATYAVRFLAFERKYRRHCERCCNGEYRSWDGRDWRHDPDKEAKAGARLEWEAARVSLIEVHDGKTGEGVTFAVPYELQGDPRGRVLRLRFPGELEAS